MSAPESPAQDSDYQELLSQAKSINPGNLDRAIQMINSLPDALILVNRKGVIEFANERTGLMFDYHVSELINKPLETLLPPEVRERHTSHFAKYFDDPRTRAMGIGMELKGLTRDGRLITVEISLVPFTDKSGVLTMAIIRHRG